MRAEARVDWTRSFRYRHAIRHFYAICHLRSSISSACGAFPDFIWRPRWNGERRKGYMGPFHDTGGGDWGFFLPSVLINLVGPSILQTTREYYIHNFSLSFLHVFFPTLLPYHTTYPKASSHNAFLGDWGASNSTSTKCKRSIMNYFLLADNIN